MNSILKETIFVAIFGALGSLSRFWFSSWIQKITHHKDYPWGIFAVNVVGCLLAGVLAGVLLHRMNLGPAWRAAIIIGFLGGFTTFSSFSLDTITLLQMGDVQSAVFNVVLTVFSCLIATAGGLFITGSLIK